MKKTISVILPNYNYEKYISSRLDEVLAQTYAVSEIVILDDASTDNSVKLIKEKVAEIKKNYPDIKVKTVFNEKNSGSVFSQWQKGVGLATSDYIWVAEIDDSSRPKFLETAMAPMIKDQDVVLSYTNSKLIGQVSIKDKARSVYDLLRRNHFLGSYVVDGREELDKNLAVFNSIPNASACVFKKLPELSKILDTAKKYKLSGDWYFYVKLAELGKIAYSSKELNKHRWSKTSVTGKVDFETRFKELQDIHKEVLRTADLSKSTKEKIAEYELKLAKNWKLL